MGLCAGRLRQGSAGINMSAEPAAVDLPAGVIKYTIVSITTFERIHPNCVIRAVFAYDHPGRVVILFQRGTAAVSSAIAGGAAIGCNIVKFVFDITADAVVHIGVGSVAGAGENIVFQPHIILSC